MTLPDEKVPDERVIRLLAELADRADGHVAAERVTGVRRRARRAAATRRSVVAAGAALAAAATVALSTGHVPALRGDRSPDAPAPTPSPAPSAGLTLSVRQDDAMSDTLPAPLPGPRAIVFVHVHGWVPARAVQASPSGREHLLWQKIEDSGSSQSSGGDEAPCTPGAPLVAVDDEYPIEVHFEKAGPNPVTYRVAACPPVGTVSVTVTVQARVRT
jgi:hypothetical protein